MGENICIFGASIIWGAWDHEQGGWVNRLRLFVESYNSEILTYNLGISGDTTTGLLKRFDLEVKTRNPKIIIFSIGINDSILIKSENKNIVPIDKFEDNVQKLIDKAREYSQKIVFVSFNCVDEFKTSPIPWQKDFYYINKNIKLYNQKIKEITSKNNVYYLDVFDLLSNEDLEDGLHPNSIGHKKLFLKIKDFLIENKLLD